MDTFLKPSEIAKILSISRASVYNYINAGLLRTKKIGKIYRISGEDFEKFLEKAEIKR